MTSTPTSNTPSTSSVNNSPTFSSPSKKTTLTRAKKIDSKLKEQILTEAALTKEPLTVIAKRHNIKVDRIYHWRMYERKIAAACKAQEAERFLEVELPQDGLRATSSNSTLQKAELEFKDYSIVLKGTIELDKLIKVCKLLAA